MKILPIIGLIVGLFLFVYLLIMSIVLIHLIWMIPLHLFCTLIKVIITLFNKLTKCIKRPKPVPL